MHSYLVGVYITLLTLIIFIKSEKNDEFIRENKKSIILGGILTSLIWPIWWVYIILDIIF